MPGYIALLILVLYVVVMAAAYTLAGVVGLIGLIVKAIREKINKNDEKPTYEPQLLTEKQERQARQTIKDYSDRRKEFLNTLKSNNAPLEDQLEVCENALDKISSMPGDQNTKKGYQLYWRRLKKEIDDEVLERRINSVIGSESDRRERKAIKEFNQYLEDQEQMAIYARSIWDTGKELSICDDTIQTISSAPVPEDNRKEAIKKWSERKAYLNDCLKKSTRPDLMVGYDDVTPVIDEEFLEGVSRFGYEDWKQDVLDYVAAVNMLSKLKNRYSALQSATFVANKLILEYLSTDSSKNFFEYIMQKCEEMPFSVPAEQLAYGVNSDIAKMLADNTDLTIVGQSVRKYMEKNGRSSRPKPEEIYPIETTGDPEIDSFAQLAKIVAHTKLKHLQIDDSDIDESIECARKNYKQREWKSFEDYFSNAFQFGYLTERRFQRLYFILYNIAQAKLEGATNSDIVQQLGNLYVIDPAKKRVEPGDEQTGQKLQHEFASDESLPFYTFTKEEHAIIAVTSRITRELYHHRLFRKTAAITIGLINRYHKLKREDAMSERQYFQLSIGMLKREDKNMQGVYEAIIRIVNSVFSGMNEAQAYAEVKREVLQPFVDTGIMKGKQTVKKDIRGYAYESLLSSIRACEFPAATRNDFLSFAERLNDNCKLAFNAKDKYYKALLDQISRPAANQGLDGPKIKAMRYILQCKINDVPDVSFRALVGSKFQELYRVEAPTPTKKSKRKHGR